MGSAESLAGNAACIRMSVVVPTRNRPAHAAACIRSILAIDGFVELIVVDQSDDRATAEAVSAIDDRRLRYVRTETRGVSNARNLGMELSDSEIVAFTDDDCRVKANWIERLVGVFTTDPGVAVVCGRVQVPKEIQHLGWAESFHPRTREWQGRYPPIGQWGITANLALRRSVFECVGPFDPILGAGAPLQSGGEPDFLFRVLRAGFKVVNAEEVLVDHLGIRQFGAEAQQLIEGYGVGTAAAFLKHVRLGDRAAAIIYLRFLISAAPRVVERVILRRRPTGARFLLGFLSGAFVSYGFAVDRNRQQYVER
jgi:glycosyltransferase involved in cell wall biosynthesis